MVSIVLLSQVPGKIILGQVYDKKGIKFGAVYCCVVYIVSIAALLLSANATMAIVFGVIVGLAAGVVTGLICGWVKRLRSLFYPVANVLAPIPSIVFAPYIVALMPTFRSASAVVIILGIFWPTFLNMMIRVDSIDRQILDSARVLNLSQMAMVFQVLLPYAFPGIINSLKVTVTTAVMMLTFAEMMGATSGMGYYIVNYNTYANYTNVVAGIIVVGIVVTMLNKIVGMIQKKVIQWQMF